MQAPDSGGLFKQHPPLCRFGADQRADPSLADHGRGMRAACQVGEQKLHVPGADVLAVNAVLRSRTAFDPAADFDFFGVVERRGRTPVRVVEPQRDFSDITGGPGRGAAEDDVFHLAAAHAFRRGFAHHPAQRFDDVGLSASIGSDDPGHSGLNKKLGGVDEGFETRYLEPTEMH